MATQTINDIPRADAEWIREEVRRTVNAMDRAERDIQASAYESFAQFLTQIAYDIAQTLGYTIAIPLAWAQNVAESLSLGLSDGFARGLREQRAHPKRRR